VANWDNDRWDIGIWDAVPASKTAGAGGGSGRRRRQGEKVIWYDDWVKSQEQEELPEEEQIEVIEEAIEVVKSYKAEKISVVDAKAAILKAKNASDMLNQVRGLEALMVAYYRIKEERRRMQDKADDEFIVLLMLGVL
tara:strand:- start:648 stop:1061 length:414 start_codon:yes stop_codon:yes gene_type:complete